MLDARALLLLVLLGGCAPRSAEPVPPTPARPPSATATAAPTAPVAVEPPPTPTLLLTEPALMAALERRGLSLAAVMGGAGDGNDELAALPTFAPLVQDLKRELSDVAARDPARA